MKELNEIENIKNVAIIYRNDIYIDIVPLSCSKVYELKELREQIIK
ncbi:hypothetical protein [Clostridium sp.]|nr:hypothetical protein [Clostridium sp.]MBS5937212.1 hypothetical protein [Clostridium sp.]